MCSLTQAHSCTRTRTRLHTDAQTHACGHRNHKYTDTYMRTHAHTMHVYLPAQPSVLTQTPTHVIIDTRMYTRTHTS